MQRNADKNKRNFDSADGSTERALKVRIPHLPVRLPRGFSRRLNRESTERRTPERPGRCCCRDSADGSTERALKDRAAALPAPAKKRFSRRLNRESTERPTTAETGVFLFYRFSRRLNRESTESRFPRHSPRTEIHDSADGSTERALKAAAVELRTLRARIQQTAQQREH